MQLETIAALVALLGAALSYMLIYLAALVSSSDDVDAAEEVPPEAVRPYLLTLSGAVTVAKNH